ncbi:hypothetical protein DZ903_030970, partial [Pseudomonas aeruginosa]|nr:hypothetical protein [Pseudomonas aeruginosa]
MNALPTSLLQRLLERPAPFALLYRPESNGPGLPRHDLLALIPYRQI